MENAKHTPGPWMQEKKGPYFITISAPMTPIMLADWKSHVDRGMKLKPPVAATVGHINIGEHLYFPAAEAEANANLIAAAAELLDALRPFAAFACDVPCKCHNCIARAALAKARGAAA